MRPFVKLTCASIFVSLGLTVLTTSCTEEVVEPEESLEVSPYTLTKVGNIGLPIANPMGITSDDENLWILFGPHNSLEHELVYYDPEEHEIIRSFTYDNLIEQLGTGVYGLTWDEESVWISVSGNTNKLVRVDPTDGEILQTWTSPTHLGPSDLAWDRDLIWIGSGTGQIYTINPAHGGNELKWIHLPDEDRDHGIAVRDDEVWIGNLFREHDVHIYDRLTSEHLGYIPGGIVEGGKFCFYQGNLAVLDESGVKFYEIVE